MMGMGKGNLRAENVGIQVEDAHGTIEILITCDELALSGINEGDPPKLVAKKGRRNPRLPVTRH